MIRIFLTKLPICPIDYKNYFQNYLFGNLDLIDLCLTKVFKILKLLIH